MRTFLRPRFRDFLVLLNAGAGGILLLFLNSILLANLLGADLFGRYLYVLAVVAVIPTFYETFNRVIVRFMGDLPPRRQLRLLLFVFSGKLLVFTVALTLFLLWYRFWGDPRLNSIIAVSGFDLVFIAAIVALPVKLVGNVLRAVLNAHQRYRGVALVTLLPTVTPVLINGGLLLAGTPVPVVLRWIALEVVLAPVVALAVSGWMLHRSEWVASMAGVRVRSLSRAVSFGYTNYFRPYGQPLATAVFFQYVKVYLPLILLGQVATFSHVAYYRILSSIGDLGIDFFPSVANAMLPTVLKTRDQRPQEFQARFSRHGALYLLGMGAVLTIFVVAHPIVLWIYGLETTPEASLAALLIALAVMQAAFAFLLNYLFLMGGDTRANYFMSPAHNIFFALAVVALMPYLLVGMMLARLLHRMFGSAMLTYVSIVRFRYLGSNHYFTLLGLTLGLSGVLVGAYLVSTTWLH